MHPYRKNQQISNAATLKNVGIDERVTIHDIFILSVLKIYSEPGVHHLQYPQLWVTILVIHISKWETLFSWAKY